MDDIKQGLSFPPAQLDNTRSDIDAVAQKAYRKLFERLSRPPNSLPVRHTVTAAKYRVCLVGNAQTQPVYGWLIFHLIY
jgi:hypothetical protein